MVSPPQSSSYVPEQQSGNSSSSHQHDHQGDQSMSPPAHTASFGQSTGPAGIQCFTFLYTYTGPAVQCDGCKKCRRPYFIDEEDDSDLDDDSDLPEGMYSKREFLRYGITECDDENPPKEPECPICHLEYGTTDNDTPAEHAIRIEHCEHTFGSECYRQWIMPTNQRYTTGDGQRNACPMCKAVLFAPPWYNRDDEVPSDIEMASDSEESSDSEDAEAAQDSHTYDPNRVYPRRSASPEENAHLRRVYTLYHMRMANLDEIEAQRLLLGAHDVEQKELDRRDAAEKLPDNPIEAERVRIQREARRVVAERKRDGLVFNICAKEARNARLLREEADERLAVEEVTWRQKVDDEGEEHSERRQPGFRVLPGGRLR